MSMLHEARTTPPHSPLAGVNDLTPVLANRPIGRQGAGSVFGDERWSFTEAMFQAHVRAMTFDWSTWPVHFKAAAKSYGWLLTNYEPHEQDHSRGMKPLAPRTVIGALSALRYFPEFLETRSVKRFSDVTADDLDVYVDWLSRADRFSRDRQNDLIWEVRRLWLYRDLLPEDARLPATPPWNGMEPRELVGPSAPQEGNKTPRIDERVMSALLGWSIRFIEDFADDIIAAAKEYSRLRLADERGPDRVRAAPLAASASDLVETFRAQSRALPGKEDEPGQLDLSHLARLLGTRRWNIVKNHAAMEVLETSGLPVAANAELVPVVLGKLDGEPWLAHGIGYADIPGLANALTAACLVVTAYLSGMRPAEVLNLRRGCLSHDRATDLWTLSATVFKGVKTAGGAHEPRGRERAVPWVVCEPVARAVRVMESLHDSDLLFPRTGLRRSHNHSYRERGLALTEFAAARYIEEFCVWVNGYCEANGRADAIPADRTRQRLALTRFRRTLAWHICRRPRGLVAASIQYGHVLTAITVGYGGNAASGFPDDYAFERFLARLEDLGAASDRLAAGEHVSGPSADLYRSRVTQAVTEFQGIAVTSGKQASGLLSNPNLQIVEGRAMACVADPARARCGMPTRQADPTATPNLSNCQPYACANVARTDQHIKELRERARDLTETVADSFAPPLRMAREQAELNRIGEVIAEHERTREAAESG